MARSQNTPRGLIACDGLYVDSQLIDANSSGILLAGGLALSGETTDIITQDSTAVKLASGLSLSGRASSKALTANSTADLIFPTTAALPSTRVAGGICFVQNSTGRMLAYHSTGTTWKYASATSVLA